MIGPAIRIEEPASLPVTVEELRSFCRVEGATEDDLLKRLAASAVARLDGYSGQLGRAIINSKWRQEFAAFPPPMEPKIRLKLPDVSAATVVAIDAYGVETSQPDDRFEVHRDFVGWYVLPRQGHGWPSGRGAIEYVAGYGSGPDDVNGAVREAICMMVQGTYRMLSAEATLRTETVDGVSSQGFFGPEIMQNATTAHVKELLAKARWRPV